MATILCIEDEAEIRHDIVEELNDAGFQTLQAGDGLEGLDVIRKKRPDLVLCDITMPQMDGMALLSEIRTKYPEFAELPFIFLTALADRQDILSGIANGADDYLTKPIDFELLLAKLEGALRQVNRMREKKEQEQIKLYNALTDKVAQAAAQAEAKEVFDDKIQNLMTEGDLGAAGKLQYINLDEVREKLGDEKWERLSDKAMSICETVIRKHLTDGDMFNKQGNDTFFIVFSKLPQSKALLKCEQIAHEVRKRLLGDSEDSTELAMTTAAKTLRELAGPDGKPDLNQLTAEWERQQERLKEARQIKMTMASRPSGDPELQKALSIRFQPVWAYRAEKIIAYHGIAYQTMPDTPGDTENETRRAEIDQFMAIRVVEHFETSAGRSNRAAVVLTLLADTLLGERRQ